MWPQSWFLETPLILSQNYNFFKVLQELIDRMTILWNFDLLLFFQPKTRLKFCHTCVGMFILLRGPFSWFDNTLACHFGIILFFRWINCIRQMFFLFFNLTQHMFLMIPNIIFCFNIIYHHIFDRPRPNWSVNFFKN